MWDPPWPNDPRWEDSDGWLKRHSLPIGLVVFVTAMTLVVGWGLLQ